MNEHSIRDVVIVGGGTAGWMVAAAFSRFLNNGYTRVTLVESEEIGTVGVGEATIPALINFNQMLGFNENDFLRETKGTFKLGIDFVDWGAKGERYFHPFGTYGEDLQSLNFHQMYLRESARRTMPDISHWSMNAMAAKNGRFGRASENTTSAVRKLVYAFHFDAGLYAGFLRRFAEANGTRRLEGRIAETVLRPMDGHVEAVTLADGRRIAGDLFIDCSGFRGLLIEEALGTGYEDWSQWLPCDRAVAVPSRSGGDPDPFTRSTAREAGWQWRIPLQHRTGNGLVYASAYLDREDAERLLLDHLEGEPLADPRHLQFVTGRRKLGWNRNVVALGLSSGFIEPLESTSIHFVQSGIQKLLALFPDKRFDPLERDEFNRMMRELYEDTRDFIILHYKATRRDDTPFWNRCRTMDIPASLERKIGLFGSKGRAFREAHELFATPSWVAVAMGQGIVPAEHEPAIDALDEAKVAAAMEQIRRLYRETAERLPSHGDFLRMSGIMPSMAAAVAPAAPPPPADPGPIFSFEQESPLAGMGLRL